MNRTEQLHSGKELSFRKSVFRTRLSRSLQPASLHDLSPHTGEITLSYTYNA
jgi:hypothetical protein